MDPNVFCDAVLFLDKVFKEVHLDEFNLSHDAPRFLKVLEYSAIIDLGDDEDLPVVVLRGIKELSKEAARLVVRIRNSAPLLSLSFEEERFIYRTLSQIYRK